MGIKCLFRHSWSGCRCSACGKPRDEGHDWGKDCENCSRCGATRQGAHRWEGCKCSTCGTARDIDKLRGTDRGEGVLAGRPPHGVPSTDPLLRNQNPRECGDPVLRLNDPAERSIRVFVSSTFRDMQAEREELAKRSFVRLRRLCAERDVVFTEVDLRWGITEEAAAEGMVLPVCLEEIRACRPFFIGLLGERYGWVPESVPAELIEAEPWLAEHLGKSVTELEILHGVLNDPAMATNCFFYIRDPRYAEARGGEFLTQDASAGTRLAELKEQIRRGGLPVREDYPDPQVLGELVFEDLAAAIDRRFPHGSEPAPLERERRAHQAFAAARTRLHVGRDEYLVRIDRHVESSSEPLVVVGESGCGKSALLANWASRHSSSHPGTFVLTHFVGAGSESAVWMNAVRRIAEEAIARFDLQLAVPREPERLKGLLGAVLLAISSQARDIVLVIDGLDLIEDRDGGLDLAWLPGLIPKGIHLVISALPGGKPLDELARRSWPQLAITGLSEAARRQLIVRYLGGYRKDLGTRRLGRIAVMPQCGNPLFLRLLLDELRYWGVHETLDAAMERYLEAGDVAELFERILARLDADYERERPHLVGDTMRLLWAARRGLSETELLTLLGAPEPLARRLFSPLFLAIEPLLVSVGGLLRFGSGGLSAAVKSRYFTSESDETRVRLQIAEHFQGDQRSPRALDERPWQLLKAEDWQGLRAFVTDPELLGLLWQRDRWDVRAYWARIEAAAHGRLPDGYRDILAHPEQSPTILSPLWELLTAFGYQEAALPLFGARARACRDSGDRQALELAMADCAQALIELGRPDDAWAILEEQEALPASARLPRAQFRLLHHKSMILLKRGQLTDALALLESEAAVARDVGDMYALAYSLSGQAIVLGALASQRHDMSFLARAEKLSEEQERLSRAVGDLDGLADSLQARAAARHCLRDSGTAMKLFEEAERLYRASGNRRALATCIGQQAVLHRDLGRITRALDRLQESETLAREASDAHTVGAALCMQADILQSLDKHASALEKASEALATARRTGDVPLAQFATMILKGIESRKR